MKSLRRLVRWRARIAPRSAVSSANFALPPDDVRQRKRMDGSDLSRRVGGAPIPEEVERFDGREGAAGWTVRPASVPDRHGVAAREAACGPARACRDPRPCTTRPLRPSRRAGYRCVQSSTAGGPQSARRSLRGAGRLPASCRASTCSLGVGLARADPSLGASSPESPRSLPALFDCARHQRPLCSRRWSSLARQRGT
jgi:hypothetical protein